MSNFSQALVLVFQGLKFYTLDDSSSRRDLARIDMKSIHVNPWMLSTKLCKWDVPWLDTSRHNFWGTLLQHFFSKQSLRFCWFSICVAFLKEYLMGFQQVSIVPKPGCLGYVGDEQPNVGSIYRYEPPSELRTIRFIRNGPLTLQGCERHAKRWGPHPKRCPRKSCPQARPRP